MTQSIINVAVIKFILSQELATHNYMAKCLAIVCSHGEPVELVFKCPRHVHGMEFT